MAIDNNVANTIFQQIRVHDNLNKAGLESDQDTSKSVGKLLGQLHQASGVAPCQITDTTNILDRVTKQPQSDNGTSLLEKLKQFVGDIRGKSETFQKAEVANDPSALRTLKETAKLAAIPYTGHLPQGNYETNPSVKADGTGAGLTSLVSAELALADGKGQVINKGDTSKGEIIDPRSGLAANLIVDKDKKIITVAFGGTTSGLNKTEDFNKRSFGNFATTLSQWVSNIKTALGIQSHSLSQARELTSKVVDIAKQSEQFADFQIQTVGHSKGASEAVYAALSQKEPLHATGFSSADLSGKLVRSLPAENVAAAKSNVSHVHVKADIVPNLRYVSPSLRPLGTESVIPTTGFAGPLGRHDGFVAHIEAFVDKQLAES